MVIDVSDVGFWSTDVIISTAIFGFVIAVGVLFVAYDAKAKSDFLTLGILLIVLGVAIGGLISFGLIGGQGHERRVEEAKKTALLQEYDDVVLTDSSFVGSKEGVFVKGFLEYEGKGKFVVLEAK